MQVKSEVSRWIWAMGMSRRLWGDLTENSTWIWKMVCAKEYGLSLHSPIQGKMFSNQLHHRGLATSIKIQP